MEATVYTEWYSYRYIGRWRQETFYTRIRVTPNLPVQIRNLYAYPYSVLPYFWFPWNAMNVPVTLTLPALNIFT